MQVSFDALALQLVSFGFSPVLYCELYCQKDGGWRSAVAQCDGMMPCPRCGIPRAAAIVAKGFTRNPGQWERWEAPLKRSEREIVNQLPDELEEREIIRRARVRHHLEASRGARPHHYRRRAVPAERFADNPE